MPRSRAPQSFDAGRATFYAVRVPYCTVNGVRIHYDVSGEGFPLVLVHANPFDRRLWLYQAAHFSTRFKIINVDIRGYGHSDKPETPTSMAEMAEDVVAVCRQEGAGEAVAAGISVGGVMVLQMGLDHPEMFKALIMVGCSSRPSDAYRHRIAGYSRGVAGFHREHLEALVAPGFPASRLGGYLLDRFTDWDPRLSGAAIVEIFKALQNRNQTERLPELRMPVLVINGESDNSRPGSEFMAARIAGAVHRVVPATGHACCLEDPVTFDGYVNDFLEQHGYL